MSVFCSLILLLSFYSFTLDKLSDRNENYKQLLKYIHSINGFRKKKNNKILVNIY